MINNLKDILIKATDNVHTGQGSKGAGQKSDPLKVRKATWSTLDN